jgi:hypothetical protein
MYIQILKSHEVNTIIENQSYDTEDLCSMIENPVVGLEKLELPYMFPFKVKDIPGRRHETNVKVFDVIFLDYDDTIGYKEAINTFKDYEFFFYTSFNNGVDGAQKFRIILPLDKEYPASMWCNSMMKKLVLTQNIFNGIDSNTMKVQGYYAPAINPKGKYFTHYNKGKKFSLDPFVKIFKKLIIDKLIADNKPQRVMTGGSVCVRNYKFRTPLGEKTVNDWLNTPFKSSGGNKWSEIGLFQCFRLCKNYKDEETKNLIWSIAKSEHWTEQELIRKWESIEVK